MMNVHHQKNAQCQNGSAASIVTRAREKRLLPRENSGASIVPKVREKRLSLREKGIPYSKKKRIERNTSRRPATTADDESEDSDIDFYIYMAPKPEEIELSSYLNRLS